jgi:hypothetical protein
MLFGGEFQPTPEEFMQAVIMTALFRKFGSVNKGPRQDVRNLPENIEKFLVRDITAKHVRSQRTVMKHDKNVFPQYI